MLVSKILKTIFLFFVVILFIFAAAWGMQWFSINVENFFSLKMGYQDIFLGSLNGQSASADSCCSQKPDLMAKAGISLELNADGSDKIILEKNKNLKLFIASLTKLMTAGIVLDNYNLSKKIVISEDAASLSDNYKAGEIFDTKTLLKSMIIESDNGAAHALAESIGYENFISLMNNKARELNLPNTFFSNSAGYGAENYSTPEDLAKLVRYLLMNNSLIFEMSSLPELNVYDSNGFFHHKAKNTNFLLTDASDNWQRMIIGGKTGETEFAGGCLILVLRAPDNKGYFINIILNSPDRFGEMKTLTNYLFDNYAKN